MASKSLSIKLGQFIKIENKSKKKSENQSYMAVQVEDLSGNNERCILFTEIEFSDAMNIDASNWFFSNLKSGRIYPMLIGKQKFYMLKIFNINGDEKILKLTQTLLNNVEKRAIKNPEDLTKKSFLRDLFD